LADCDKYGGYLFAVSLFVWELTVLDPTSGVLTSKVTGLRTGLARNLVRPDVGCVDQ
jgi:hypothetical protein